MNLEDKINILYYKYLLKKIEKLNWRNVKGYDSFKEYILADEKMLNYFNKLKSAEKRLTNLRVDSYETFESNVFKQLNDIYNKMLLKIFKLENIELKKQKLLELKKDLEASCGYSYDKKVKELIKDLEDKINNTELYKINNQSSDNYEEPLFDEIVDFVIYERKASASLLQRRFRFGYNRAVRCVDLLEEYGIIGPQIGSKPREILITEKSQINYNNKIIKQTKKEYEDFITNAKNDEEIAKLLKDDYNISIEFDKIDIYDNLKNIIFTNSKDENEKSDFIDNIIKYSRPSEIKLVLIDKERFNFNYYSNLPHLMAPMIYDTQRINICMKRLVSDMNIRLDKFVEVRVKTFNEYKEKIDNKFPGIIVVISEIFDLLKDKEFYDDYVKLLLNGERTGIKIVSFSKFSKRNLELKNTVDLLKIYNKYEFNLFESSKKNKNETNTGQIEKMTGLDFEKYSAQILEANGFKNVEVTKSSGDFGVDIIAYKDDIKYAIQCKNYSSPVGIKAVQEVIGSKTMNNCHVAVVLTNNYFTKSAKELAEKNNVLLWDNDKLEELITNKTNNN